MAVQEPISHKEAVLPPRPTSPPVAMIWITLGLICPILFLVLTPPGDLTISLAPLGIYLLAVLGLDLYVGASSGLVHAQRITPAVVLGLLLTPGIPASIALVVDLIGVATVVAMSRFNYDLLAQAGRSLIPASVTATYLYSKGQSDSGTTFFACEIFILASLVARNSRPPFRTDIFLIISYPAVALLLRYLTEMSLTYVVLAVPLLFLLTTVETDMLGRYFQLRQRYTKSQTQVRESRIAHRQTEIESRRKGLLLQRKEQQLSLLNGLGRQLDSAQAAEDLASFLLKESLRLTGAEVAVVLLQSSDGETIEKILCSAPAGQWGIAEGQKTPRLKPPSITAQEPWPAPLWKGKRSFLVAPIGAHGFLVLGKSESEGFPDFLEEFFSAVARHAASAILALRRLNDVRAVAKREAQEKRNVASEKEKVAEQNRNLRLLLESFDSMAQETLASDQLLHHQASLAVKRMTGAEKVVFRAPPADQIPHQNGAIQIEDQVWPSYIFRPGQGPSGNLLCLSPQPNVFTQGHLEWCDLLQDFLDKTMENSALHSQLQDSYAQLQRTQQEIVLSSQWAAAGRLAANAAHELNTPLGAVRIAAEHISLYLDHGGDSRPAKESMTSLLNSVDKCRRVTDRLLLTSRPVDQGAQPHKPKIEKLTPILRDAIASVNPYLRVAKVKLVVPEPLPDYQGFLVYQDLYWAIVNLCKNAIDAIMEANPKEKTITFSLSQTHEFVEISVTDCGTGVKPEVQSRLFEPFFTTKKLGQGNGLGLSMSRTNLRRWQGDLVYQDSPEGGSTFVMKVPRA